MEKLGIDLFSVVVQIVNFVLLMMILKKVLYKPLLSYIKKKAEEEKLFEKSKLELLKNEEEVTKKSEKILADAKKKAQVLIDEAKKEADAYSKDRMQKVDQKSKQLLKDSEERIGRDVLKNKNESEKKIKMLAKEMLEKVLRESVDKSAQDKIIDNSISKLDKLHAVK